MIAIAATDLGRRFQQRWAFRGLNFAVAEGQMMGILGSNGSGKSTLLRMVAGQLAPNQGTLSLTLSGAPLPAARCYTHLSWDAPSIGLYPELTVAEAAQFHFRFKTCRLAGGPPAVLDALDLGPHQAKQLRHLSSGLLQRLKVGLALYSRSHLLLLDEPGSYLDPDQAARIRQLIIQEQDGRTTLWATNDPDEMALLPNVIRF